MEGTREIFVKTGEFVDFEMPVHLKPLQRVFQFRIDTIKVE